MKRLMAIVTLVWALALQGSSADSLFAEANRAYSDGDFRVAATLYDSLLQSGYRSAAIHFNRGNAYYRLNDYGPAILHFERALRLDPANEDIHFNLKLANLHTVDKVSPAGATLASATWQRLLHWQSTRGWAISGIVLLWLVLGAGAVFLYARSIALRQTAFFSGVALLLAGTAFLLLGWQRWQLDHPPHPDAIILAPNAYVKAEPSQAATDLFIIHEGLKVTVTETADDWTRILVDGNKQGWVPGEVLEEI